MKTGSLFLVALVAVLAAAGGWYAGQRQSATRATEGSPGRKLLYYQSAMHPWIKSDQPGKCTICGMDLTPVYEGDQAPHAMPGTVVLNSNAIQVIHVRGAAVERRPLERHIRVAGVIENNDTTRRSISAYVEGRVDELFVNYLGQEVQAGQPLARFYSPTLLSAVREYRSLLRIPETNTTALKDGELGALEQAARLRLRQLGLTESQIAAFRGPIEEDMTHIDLVAPVSGTVVGRSIYAGQYVKEGDRLFEMADLSTLWFKFDAYESDLSWMQVGQTVEITTAALPGKTLRAPITFIDPTINGLTRAAKVRVELPNPVKAEPGPLRRELFHQLFAEGRIHVVGEPVLTVPRSAVLYPGGRPVVYLDQGGGAYDRRGVRLGRHGDSHWEVLEGVAEGERVVVAANFLIDSQAQLDASVAGSIPAHHAPHDTPSAAEDTALVDRDPATISRLVEPQISRLTDLFHAASAVSAALAADDLEAFHRSQTELIASGQPTRFAPEVNAQWESEMAALQRAFAVHDQENLAAARRWFLPVSHALVAMARQARRASPVFAFVRIYQCPMVHQAWTGAPRNGFWIQSSGPLRNPYFGAEMLECGKEETP